MFNGGSETTTSSKSDSSMVFALTNAFGVVSFFTTTPPSASPTTSLSTLASAFSNVISVSLLHSSSSRHFSISSVLAALSPSPLLALVVLVAALRRRSIRPPPAARACRPPTFTIARAPGAGTHRGVAQRASSRAAPRVWIILRVVVVVVPRPRVAARARTTRDVAVCAIMSTGRRCARTRRCDATRARDDATTARAFVPVAATLERKRSADGSRTVVRGTRKRGDVEKKGCDDKDQDKTDEGGRRGRTYRRRETRSHLASEL